MYAVCIKPKTFRDFTSFEILMPSFVNIFWVILFIPSQILHATCIHMNNIQ